MFSVSTTSYFHLMHIQLNIQDRKNDWKRSFANWFKVSQRISFFNEFTRLSLVNTTLFGKITILKAKRYLSVKNSKVLHSRCGINEKLLISLSAEAAFGRVRSKNEQSKLREFFCDTVSTNLVFQQLKTNHIGEEIAELNTYTSRK